MKRAFSIWFLLLVALAAPAAAQSLDLTRARVAAGGSVSGGGQFTLFSTVGQPESAPRVAGGAFTLDTGFLGATLPSAIPTVYFPSGTVTVLEDAGVQTRVSYATFEPGDAGLPAQPATFRLSNNNTALFSVQPAMDTSRTLTFTPAANANGTATVTVVVRADGLDVATNTFAIVVTPVNDAPAVTLAGNQTVLEDAGAQSVGGFATFNAGPADESTQTPTYTLAADNPALFSVQPAIAANGTLTFTSAANANGSATITVVASDGGDTANGGVDRATNSFTISVTAVNDAPAVAYATNNVVVLEDAGAQSVSGFAAFTAGPADESVQAPSYTLKANTPALFSSPPALLANGTLTFTPAPNANGSAIITVITADDGGTANGGVDRATNTFTITVMAVNDAPAAIYSTNHVVVLEDAGAQSVNGFAVFTAGPADESAQTPNYTLTADNLALFSAQPTIAANGTLTFTPAANANGSSTVTVVVVDSGATANGGVDRATNMFTLSVMAVNDTPSITLAQSTVTVLEDAGAQSLAGFAIFSPGPANESAQALVAYTISHNGSGLFNVPPALAANGTLTFTPAANANGSATVRVIAQDNGGTADGGVDRTTNIFTIAVTAVNDAPSLAFSANPVAVALDAGPQTFSGFATFTAGPADEAAQTPAYTVTTDNAGLFIAAPAIAANGTLTFTPVNGVGGVATVTVIVQDTGGIANGGVDKATNTFTLSVLTFAGVADNLTMAEDTALTRAASAGVLANDIGSGLRAVLVATTTNGTHALNHDGSFTYQPVTNFFGTDHFTYLATNTTDTSAVTVVTITLKPVNDAPSVAYLTNEVVVLENVGAQSVAGFATFSPGPANEAAQTLVDYTVSNSSNALFSVQPAINNAGLLTFTPAAHANGSATVTVVVQDNGGTLDGGVDKATNTFLITLKAVNDAPSMVLAQATLTVLEDAGAQSVAGFAVFTSGPANESAQTPTYTLTTDNTALFGVAPAINSSGVLTFMSAAHANGSATVTVVVQDSGGTLDGGVDKATNTFTIAVTPVNDAPSVAFATNLVVLSEDAGAQSVVGFAAFSAGPANEAAQTLVSYTVSNSSNTLFSAQPAVDNAGVLTFTPAMDANGIATVTVVVQDDGGTANGGMNRSTNTFVIALLAVNDAPSVVFVQNTVTVLEDSGPSASANFAIYSPGRLDEVGQVLVGYTVSNSSNALFSVQPAIDLAGQLTFTPATNANGSATVTVVVRDSGGVAEVGDVDRSTNTFTIVITPVSDAPGVSFATNEVVVLEDAGAQSVAGFATFTAGPANEEAQNLVSYTVSNSSNALFSVQPAINNAGLLTFTPAAQANGSALVTVIVQDSGGVVDGGVDKATNTFLVTLKPVNDAPSVAYLTNEVVVLEDAGAQSVTGFAMFTAGPANEVAQTLVGYTVSNSSNALFSVQPAINNAGLLTFTPAAHANGSATVTVVVQDSGGTLDGGVDKATNAFLVTLKPVNDAPGVSFATNEVVVLEDAGAQSVAGFATFTAGPVNEVAQTLVGYTVSNSRNVLFSVQPAINNAGLLTFTPAAHANGSALVTVIVQDSGGVTDGGVDKATNTFLVTLKPVNDAPGVSFATNEVVVLEDAGAQSVVGFATFTPGPANEAAQTLVGYTVSNSSNVLFSVQPAINNAGLLTFTPAAHANGSATVTVVVQDSGGTLDGGVDKATNSFTIVVTPVNDAPSVTFAQTTVTVLEDAGTAAVSGFAMFSPGPVNESAQALMGYSVTVDNPALFATAPAINNAGLLIFTPATNANGSAIVTVVVQDNGGTAHGGVDKSTNTCSIVVTPVNDAPSVTFVQNTVTVLEDSGAQSLSAFAAFSSGPANESAQVLIHQVTVDNAALFAAVPAISDAGVLTFTPATNANGIATVTVVVLDSGGSSLQGLLMDVFHLGGVTLVPGAGPYSGPWAVPPGGPLIGSTPASQPTIESLGVDRSTNTFTIVVTAVNDTPVANNDSYTMSQGDVLGVAAAGVLANDTDVENHALTATKLTNPSHGTISFSANGGFTYTPDTNFYGVDSFTYRASDGSSNSTPATVILSVLARPVITPPPGRQRVFSSAALRFSATNAPDINAIRVSDPDSTALTLLLTVTNGTLAVTVTNGLSLPNGSHNTNALVLAGLTTDLNAALESLAYVSVTNYFGDDALVLVAQDEGGRSNRGGGVFDIQVEIPARGPSLEVPLNGYNNPGVGRMVTNATAVTLDTNLVQGITYDPTNNVVRVQPVGGQDGATNRSSVTVLARYSDGTTELITVPVIIYNPLLTTTTNNNAYDATFTTPLFNLQTSLYEQKVRVQNNTPFDFTALRITATNLPATVTLQNATLTNGGLPYIDHNIPVSAGSNVTLKLEYFSSDLLPFTPGLKLELLNQQRTNAAPTNTTMSAVSAKSGFSPDGKSKNYLKFPTELGRLYYVQYQDVAGPVWKTSPVTLRGTGFFLNWLDDGPPNTDTLPGRARFYRVVTDR